MFSRTAWMTLLAAGPTPVLNLGSTGEDVRRVQRALNAASAKYKLPITGVLDPATQAALLAWQAKNGIAGVTNEVGNVVGLMPHPEHAVEALTGAGTDGLGFFTSLGRLVEQTFA